LFFFSFRVKKSKAFPMWEGFIILEYKTIRRLPFAGIASSFALYLS